eukprot:TRINITY_DN1995_c0_g1_i1.p1 TRINITY_DN1995_c0_g1~~TRINITY_DN1995_c0_g1_i1.p1  ORF type:complete len:709 (-),score=134.08 TRINITY_DN1995_c0_g1_i1:35-2161(-)
MINEANIKSDAEKTVEELLAELENERKKNIKLKQERQQEKLASVVLDHMVQMVVLLDKQGKCMEANRIAINTAGTSRERIQGMHFWNALSFKPFPETIEKVRNAIETVKKEKRSVKEEFAMMKRKFNLQIQADFAFHPMLDSAGNLEYILAEGRDITDKKHAEVEVEKKNQELKELYDRLREIDLTKSHFIATVSHELRTPLALILGTTQWLEHEEVITSEKRQHAFSTINSNAYILLKRVNDLLEISKLESGKVELHTVDIDLAMFLEQICSHFEVLAKERNIDFRRLFNRNIVAHLDVEKIERIVFNLLSNAFKFTPEKGVIAISSKLGNDGKQFTIVVEDSGPGIPEQMWPKIFQRFLTLGDNEGGAGLGLAIVKELTEAQGGHAQINRSVHGGVLMEITLPVTLLGHSPAVKRVMNPSSGTSLGAPVANTAAQMMAELRSHLQRDNAQQVYGQKTSQAKVPHIPVQHLNNGSSQGSARQGPSEDSPLILVVEDNVAMNSFLKDTLGREYRVVTAVNGQEGVKLALKFIPDCIVSDVMMPIMSGEEMVHIIRDHRELETVPILLLTAKADDELKVRLLRSGVQDFLQKPFKLDDLLARVKNLVTMRQTWDSLQRALQAQSKNLRELVDDITTLFGQDKAYALPHTITQQFGDLIFNDPEAQQETTSNNSVSLAATTDFDDESTSEDEDEESSDSESNESAENNDV